MQKYKSFLVSFWVLYPHKNLINNNLCQLQKTTLKNYPKKKIDFKLIFVAICIKLFESSNVDVAKLEKEDVIF
jgi:hypothetical protein